jgi:hypothetical protein
MKVRISFESMLQQVFHIHSLLMISDGSVLHGSVEDLLAYWLDPVMGVEDHSFLQTAWMTFPKYICTHEELFNLLLTALFASPETEVWNILIWIWI